MIPVVLVQVSRQKQKVRRLDDYCLNLDGTEITVLRAPPEIDAVPAVAAGHGSQLCFEFAMKEMKGTPFFWMEVDAIPRQPGWKAAIVQEWRGAGKQFLLPDLTGLHKYDVASGIGIYPANALDIIPQGLRSPCLWDLWVYTECRCDIHYTRLIQHSYMNYPEWRPWQFPRDENILRPDALLFHRDAYQTLIGGVTPEEELEDERRDGALREAMKTRHLGTAAGSRQKNLSTSAELFQ
jgi:hypothetical protein